MKRIHLFIYLAAISVNIACSGWDNNYGDKEFKAFTDASLEVEQELDFASGASSQALNVNCRGCWQATTAAGWVMLSQDLGEGDATIDVQVEANKSTQSRRATVAFSNGLVTQNVIVTQAGVVLPTLTAISFSNITKHEAVLSFSYSSSELEVTEAGICISTSSQPDISSANVQKQRNSGKQASLTFAFKELKSKTTYYARPYVVTDAGVQYGETTQFTTLVSAPNEGDNQTPQG